VITADGKAEAAAAVTMETASRDPSPNVSDWKTADVVNWLQINQLDHLQTWYTAGTYSHFARGI